MISNKEAVNKAKEFAAQLLDAQKLSLEEIELDNHNGKDVWNITLGFPHPFNPMGALFPSDPIQLKRFLIDAETGELVAMKLRELAVR